MKGMATLMMNDKFTRKVEDAFGLGCPTLRYALGLAVCRLLCSPHAQISDISTWI